MKNGGSLAGHTSSTNNTVIVPLPGNDSIYYVFTVGAANETSQQLQFNVVNMKGDGGLGEVDPVGMNLIVEDKIFEKIAAIKHCNNKDTWIVVHKWDKKIPAMHCNAHPVSRLLKNAIVFNFLFTLLPLPTMQNIRVHIINTSSNELPAYATEGSAGMDIRANLQSPVILQPLQRELIPTGLFIELPYGYEAQVRPRSGLAIKQGITCLNSPGTVDADYRGELKVILINLSNTAQTILHGDRIAQMIIAKAERAELVPVQELNETSRGEGGFGHTGIK